jgi:hypothetical protein
MCNWLIYIEVYSFLSYVIGSPCGFLNCLCYKTSKTAFLAHCALASMSVSDVEGTFLKIWYLLFLIKFVYGLSFWVMWITLNKFIDTKADLLSVGIQFKLWLMSFLVFVIFSVQMLGQYLKTDHDSSFLIHCNKSYFTLVVDTAFYLLTSTLHAHINALEIYTYLEKYWINEIIFQKSVALSECRICEVMAMKSIQNLTAWTYVPLCSEAGFLDPLESICTIVFQLCI